ncbi:contractile injection system protein, VgrG/Pvc8 family [Aurantiacibacter suaedae]|uniref:contractile injection system protein, VgrG/Pvc8 family n=1 Tax=Aurantiacibacter suaedae TaxID=2545755 RepID=UPI0010F6C882|nr:contractile injection system protein, VgrG/Pvc8 family [Aurantiacibacter suaedae]
MAEPVKMPVAAWKVTLDGRDLTDTLAPILIAITITEKRGDEADQLDITLSDADGLIEIPRKGATLKVQLGWKQGTGLPIGLIDKGTYVVDEVTWRGNPDTISITARSADMTDALRVRRERSFVDQSVKTIVETIAAANGLAAKVDANLGAKIVPALGHGAKSDAALLKALGDRFDAVATIKAATLIFAAIGSGRTAGGSELPVEMLTRSDTDGSGEYSRVDQNDRAGVTARWHNRETGTRETVTIGGKGEGRPVRLRQVYASEADARQAAIAENSRLSRQLAKMTIKLCFGRPDIFPERPIALSGFKPEIDARRWIVAECTHTMDGSGGLVTGLSLEAAS